MNKVELKIQFSETELTLQEKQAAVSQHKTLMMAGVDHMVKNKIMTEEEGKNVIDKILQTTRHQLRVLFTIEERGEARVGKEDQELYRSMDRTWADTEDGCAFAFRIPSRQ